MGRNKLTALILIGTMSFMTGADGQTGPASLVADSVTVDAERGTVEAVGNVEVFYEGRVLRARRITYDQETDEIRAEGPVTLTDPAGAVFVADSAALTPDLNEGLIEGARLLIDGRLQLATSELRRKDGRFSTFERTIASSCKICSENPRPTWALRAARVTQDEAARRIYFEDAVFEFFGVPVAYLPRLSVPDPRERRASGFLLPEYLSSDIYGIGFRLPYYRVLGPYADATVTPFLTTDGAALLEGEYRHRFSNGGYDFSGVFAFDDGTGEFGRGALATDGRFRLRGGFFAEFDINLASDKSFLRQFDYSNDDRLTSEANVTRTRREDFLEIGTIGFQTLRDDEDQDTVPFILPDVSYRRRAPAPLIGGMAGIDFDALGVSRNVGRDVLRAGGGLDWRREWIVSRGLQVAAVTAAEFDAYQVRNDPQQDDGGQAHAVPTVAVNLRWPLVRDTGGASHLIEPIVQVIYSEILGDADVPNEDSQLPELDETNLFSLNRFPGRDRYETGLRANIGATYTRYDPDGWNLGMTLGRVIRREADPGFPEGTGLSGRLSDFVGALNLSFDTGLRFSNRALFDDDLVFQRNEIALAFDSQEAALEASYVYLAEDDSNPLLGPQPETDEFGIEGRYRFHPNWEVRGLWRYDGTTQSNLITEGGITYGNECAEFDLSISRSFTSSDNVPPSTSVRFGLKLAGFGDPADADWPPRACRLQGT